MIKARFKKKTFNVTPYFYLHIFIETTAQTYWDRIVLWLKSAHLNTLFFSFCLILVSRNDIQAKFPSEICRGIQTRSGKRLSGKTHQNIWAKREKNLLALPSENIFSVQNFKLYSTGYNNCFSKFIDLAEKSSQHE